MDSTERQFQAMVAAMDRNTPAGPRRLPTRRDDVLAALAVFWDRTATLLLGLLIIATSLALIGLAAAVARYGWEWAA